jgi:DNA-nicking Smr family endonuclease
MKEIDLHGLTHDEAVLKVENFVLLESQNELFECRIITG